MNFAFTVQGVMTILGDCPDGCPAPFLDINEDNISFDWYCSPSNMIELSMGGEYGDGVITGFIDGNPVEVDYCPSLLTQVLSRLIDCSIREMNSPHQNPPSL